MKPSAKKFLLAALLALAFSLRVFAGVQLAFDAPVDCSHYVAGGGSAVKFEIKSIDYDTGAVRFMLVDSGGQYLGNGAVFGVTLAPGAIDQDNVKAAILAVVAAAG